MNIFRVARSTLPARVSCASRALPYLYRPNQSTLNTLHTSSTKMGEEQKDLDAWKYRAPYKVHENDPNFKVRYEGSCHCGKVQYQLSREKPLDAKYCHCSTCQTLHGTFLAHWHWH